MQLKELNILKVLLQASELLRIENATTRIGKPITVVGSRASGTAKAFSDWDYVIEGGLNSKNWSKIKNSLPALRSLPYEKIHKCLPLHEVFP